MFYSILAKVFQVIMMKIIQLNINTDLLSG